MKTGEEDCKDAIWSGFHFRLWQTSGRLSGINLYSQDLQERVLAALETKAQSQAGAAAAAEFIRRTWAAAQSNL